MPAPPPSPHFFLRVCSDQLAPIFTQISNKALEFCRVSSRFKRSILTATPKKKMSPSPRTSAGLSKHSHQEGTAEDVLLGQQRKFNCVSTMHIHHHLVWVRDQTGREQTKMFVANLSSIQDLDIFRRSHHRLQFWTQP